MSSARILYVCQEMTPFVPDNQMSRVCRQLPQQMQEKGGEVRIFMPRYGCINERRNQLHEVIRLSGMNIVIDDTDHQLIIKVASIPMARLQVYFIDNEDYFQRKGLLADPDGNYYDDNDERAIFFSRGVIETVSKLRWSPQIVHCHGWFSFVMAAYVKKVYQDDPLFAKSKIVLSLYDQQTGDYFPQELNAGVAEKLINEEVPAECTELLKAPNYTNVARFALQFADGLILAGNNIDPDTVNYAKETGIPILDCGGEEENADKYAQFYEEVLSK